MNKNHRDCINFAPIDVAKGVCHLSGVLTASDERTCLSYKSLPKCENCLNYKELSVEDGTGECTAERTNFMAYKDMTAVTCKWHKQKD